MSIQMTNRAARIFNQASEEANKSELNYKHGAVITKNGKKICGGFNHSRSYFNRSLCCSTHAERHVCKKMLTLCLKGKKIKNDTDLHRYTRKMDIYITRDNGYDNTLFQDSAPCKACADYLKKMNFRNIFYTLSDGSIVKVKSKDLESSHYSAAQITMKENINFGSSNKISLIK